MTDDISTFRISYNPWTEIGRALYFNNQFEQVEIRITQAVLKPESDEFDIGANIGWFSLALAERSKVKKHFLSSRLPPQREIYRAREISGPQ